MISAPLPPTITRNIAIQGVRGSFHEIAARRFFGEEIVLDMCNSFPELFQSLAEKRSDVGVVAIENSVAGSLLPNYALLRESNQQIIGEVYLRISHQLMALPGQSLADIREAHSHPMALQQCQAFLGQHRHIKSVEREDTAGSAAWIVESGTRGVAAIASDLASKHYGLEILAPAIETHPRNYTRFLIVVDRDQAAGLQLQPNKASLCFTLTHQVGGLSQVLLILSSHGMNLTKIQSLPLIGQEWEYFFHIDLTFDDYEQYKRALSAINFQVQGLRILGEYQQGALNNQS